MKDAKGFSMIELVVTISIIAILTAIAVPGFIKWLPNYHLKEAADDLRSNFEKARITAIKQSTNCAIRFTATGYVVFIDGDNNFLDSPPPSKDTDIVTVLFSSYPSVSFDSTTFLLTGSPAVPTFAFQPTGMPAQKDGSPVNAYIKLKNTNGKTSSVWVYAAGTTRIE